MPSNSPGVKALGERIDKALTPHGVLGIARDTSSSEIRAAYIELVKVFHPDVDAGDPLAESRFLRIQEAYSQIKSSYPLFWAYKTRDARSHRHMLWLALTFFVLPPAAILLAAYGLREAPGTMQVKQTQGQEAISHQSPKVRPRATPPGTMQVKQTQRQEAISHRSPKVPADERCKVLDAPDVILLRLLAEMPRGHIVDHALRSGLIRIRNSYCE
jgi:DnaJ domain